jgi:tetratricopeptide (TPR) repeat protein
MRRIGLWLGVVLVIGLAAVLGYRVLRQRQLRQELQEAETEFNKGLTGSARRRLVALESRWPGHPEVEFRLGACEQAIGRLPAALQAWERVPAASSFGVLAQVRRATVLVNTGRYTPAEQLLEPLRGTPGADGQEVRQALLRLYALEGRRKDGIALLESSWDFSTDRAALLKSIWDFETMVPPYDRVRTALLAGDQTDDRIWLGLANLETQVGQFAEAKPWLMRCLEKRPEDFAVWRAALELAKKTNDLEVFASALNHLPASQFTYPEILSLRAWAAGLSQDDARERKALVDLLNVDPYDAQALERLAELAVKAGRAEEAADLRRRKAKIDLAKEPFRELYLDDGDYRARAEDLARLAELRGLRFQARGWADVLLSSDPKHAEAKRILARLKASEPPAPPSTGLLSDLLKDALPRGAADRMAVASVKAPRFDDDADKVGLRFVYDNGASPYHQLPETMAGGVALLDYDGDGWIDVYVVQGGPFNAEVSLDRPGDRLFHNNGDGTFRDVTVETGIAALPHGYSLGVSVGDYDNDGDPDLFISRLRSYVLLRNQGNSKFEDVTEQAGLAGPRDNPTSSAFADLDNDGDLDLYVCHYMVWDPANPRLCKKQKEDGGYFYFYCDPSKVEAAKDHVFRNDGGRFVDVTKEAGFTDPDGRGLGVIAAHLDDDDLIDLFVANDGTANYFFRNRGGFKFEETALVSGLAGNAEGGYQAGMGVACGDLDGDGLVDVAVTNFYGQSTTLYHNLGGGMFADWTTATGLGVATRYLLGFGISFLDYDNDGRLDVLTANGNVNDGRPNYPYAMPVQLLAGANGNRLIDVSHNAGAPWDVLRVGRALADGDIDNDGKIDALIVSLNEPLAYFHNKTEGGHALALRLEGSRSNRDAVGARLRATIGGKTHVIERIGGGSYQSARDGRLHIGLGNASKVDTLEIRWPSGHADRFEDLRADTGYHLKEGNPTPVPLKGFGAASSAIKR